MSYPVFKYLLGLEAKELSLTCKAIPSALGALDAKLKHKDTVSPIGHQRVHDDLQALCQNAAAYGWSRLEVKDRDRVHQLVVVFRDRTWTQLDKILFVHTGLGGRVEQASGLFGRLKTRTKALAAVSQRSIIAGMSRVPGISGSYGDFYFHPPTRLRDAIITQRELSRAALGEAARAALAAKEAL